MKVSLLTISDYLYPKEDYPKRERLGVSDLTEQPDLR